MSKTLLYDDLFFREHDTGNHVECARRLTEVDATLAGNAYPLQCEKVPWEKASTAALLRAHTPDYLERLEEFTASGGGQIEQDTILSPQSLEVARYASGAACDAVSRVMDGQAPNAFCLIRPPGHHA